MFDLKTMLRTLSLYFFFLFFVSFSVKVFAHPLSPSLWEWKETRAGQVSMIWKTPVAKVRGEDLIPEISQLCQKINSGKVLREGVFWIQSFDFKCDPSWSKQSFTVKGIETSRSQIILKIDLADGRHYQQVLNADTPSYVIPKRESKNVVFKNYFPLGFHHILSGWDHLLFVMGLFLLIRPGKKLLFAITSFTLGHSITLSLAALDLIFIPSRFVEVLIALSILILAHELLVDQKVKTTFFHRHSWVMAFVFGLLHGLGFAGALAEVGLPMGEIPLALFCFNLGIEAGQLCFIVGLWLVWKALRALPVPMLLRKIEVPAYVIGALAAFWFFERWSEAMF